MAAKSILISIPYAKILLLPAECAQFLPYAEIVESQGYGLDRETRKTRDQMEVTFIDADDLLEEKAEPEPSIGTGPMPEAASTAAPGGVIENEDMPF
jgi:hypothetical protein